MYLGPETLMPLASALAAVTGILLMFWRRTVDAARAVGRFFSTTFSRIFASK